MQSVRITLKNGTEFVVRCEEMTCRHDKVTGALDHLSWKGGVKNIPLYLDLGQVVAVYQEQIEPAGSGAGGEARLKLVEDGEPLPLGPCPECGGAEADVYVDLEYGHPHSPCGVRCTIQCAACGYAVAERSADGWTAIQNAYKRWNERSKKG